MTPVTADSFGPLKNGSTVAIIGGGPTGTGCAIAIKNIARSSGKEIHVVLFEGKSYETHYNQCAGVLSPPILDIMERKLFLEFPCHLIQREIAGYVLHTANRTIRLTGDEGVTYAVRRVALDDFFLKTAREKGVEVIHSRVTDIEITDNRVMVYSESRNSRADFVIGAFGLDDGTARVFERRTPYRQPAFLSSIVTKIHPDPEYLSRFGDYIHAFLPPIKEIEFGALTPKKNHITVNIAGRNVDSESMDMFLQLPAVKSHLPGAFEAEKHHLFYFKGKFPCRVSKGYCGNRYIVVGDAAGFIRPFKGKGINMALLSGIGAARAAMISGISRDALSDCFRATTREVADDRPYSAVLRWLATGGSSTSLMDSIVAAASDDIRLKNALFNSVSAQETFKKIFRDSINPKSVFRVLTHAFRMKFRRGVVAQSIDEN